MNTTDRAPDGRKDAAAPRTIPSTFAILQHPIHPMIVVYPISLLSLMLASDLAHWHTGEAFWALCSFWLGLSGFGFGVLAALVGMADFFTMGKVRRHVSAWNHFLCGVTVVSLAGANVVLRLADPVEAVLPWGLFLSAVLLPMVMVTGWLGGTLTFRHSIGTFSKDMDPPDNDSSGTPRPVD